MGAPRLSRWTVVVALPLILAAARPAPAAEEKAPLREVQVRGVMVDPRNQQPVVLLEDKKAGVVLPVWVGPSEAQAILMELNKVSPPRPMTHDLMRNLVGGLKGEVLRVVITELKGGTYFALIDVKGPGRSFSIDSRPSDAIALALRTKAPIFARAEALRAAIPVGEESQAAHRGRLGLVLQAMTPALAKFFGGGKAEGLLVSQVQEGAPAARAGLRRGDVILQAGGKAVATPEAFEEVFSRSGDSLTVAVRRGPGNGEALDIRIDFAAPSGGTQVP